MTILSSPGSAVAILAAGEGRRFGAIKQLADYRGKPLLQHVLDHCLELNEDIPVYLVLGAHRNRILPKLRLGRSQLIINDDWPKGMSGSIACAVRSISVAASRMLFIAGDQPLVNTKHLLSLLSGSMAHPDRICAASYNGVNGIPAVFPCGFFPALTNLQGDRGARDLLRDPGSAVVAIPIDAASIDIDRPQDI